MLFTSFGFLVFLPVVFLLYWLLLDKQLNLQNNLLLFASYFFYACWDYRFLALLGFSTLIGYYTGQKIAEVKSGKQKKRWLWLYVFVSLGLLFFFKYYDFFATSFAQLLTGFGLQVNVWVLKLVLPLGISFYTFHGLSYVIDIYNKKISPSKSFSQYALFVSFFPLLIAGPIERGGHLLPQLERQRIFDRTMAVDGLRQMLWGFFKKIVIADNCALYVNMVFAHSSGYSGSTVLLASAMFTVQIYCDFSAYSDIALGTAKLFGIRLMRNFNFPLFATDISKFWQRWHISLTTLANEFIYTPLSIAFRDMGRWGTELAIVINFTIIGIWHGANWTFILFGFLHGCYFIPIIFRSAKRKKKNTAWSNALKMSVTFLMVTLSLIIFRAEDVSQAFQYIKSIFSLSLFQVPQVLPVKVLVFVLLFLSFEWIGKSYEYPLQMVSGLYNANARLLVYTGLVFLILFLGNFGANPFIYFQF